MIKKEDIQNFINSNNYDVRVTKNGRWMDQKCTPDVVMVIASAIIQYCEDNSTVFFTTKDILESDFARNEIREIFKKPDTLEYTAKSEYDKFFQQPMKMLAAAGVLRETGRRPIVFEIIEFKILEHISLSERFALDFVTIYVEKALNDSGLYSYFDTFLNNPTKGNFKRLKTEFEIFQITNTPINTERECGRIFTKVLNPLAYKFNSKGTKKGRLSKDIITKDMLMYNRNNFRDLYHEKPRGMTRQQYIAEKSIVFNNSMFKFQSTQAKRRVKLFNKEYEGGYSQYSRHSSNPEEALHMHHIFPSSDYSSISGYVENIIALSPNEHLSKAHPKSNTSYISESYQKDFLLIRAEDIEHYNNTMPDETIYSFTKFNYVLSEGFGNEEIYETNDTDYGNVVNIINGYYSEE